MNPVRALLAGARALEEKQTVVMGILNVTPDSFSDGGQHHNGRRVDVDAALRTVEGMQRAGVGIVDIGGESTRPDATPVCEREELDRVLPVISAVKERFDLPISVDTSSAEVIRAAAAAGAHMVNDVRALQRCGALDAAVSSGLPVCLMHMQKQPSTMQDDPFYHDVVTDVIGFLLQRRNVCVQAGMKPEQIVIDPGFGFGKTTAHNMQLFHALSQFVATGMPVLVGVSRKRMIGELLGLPADKRLIGSVILAVFAAQRGASIVRVHDVEETVQALRMLHFTHTPLVAE